MRLAERRRQSRERFFDRGGLAPASVRTFVVGCVTFAGLVVDLVGSGPLAEPVDPGLGSAEATGTGSTFQICSQYSRIVRSEEKNPHRAVLRIDIFDQADWSRHARDTASC